MKNIREEGVQTPLRDVMVQEVVVESVLDIPDVVVDMLESLNVCLLPFVHSTLDT